jgi:hypothetical protein
MSESMTESVALGVLGISVPAGTHLCVFVRGSSGLEDIVLPFLAEGIRANDRCLCILESRVPSDVLSRLALQVDVGPSVATGQLELATPPEAYLRSGQFSTEDMLGYWADEAAATRSRGNFSLTRATGEMPSILGHPAGRAEFFRYESMLNTVIPKYPQIILCLYDLERFGAEVLMDALRTHPMVVVDGMVHDNPYYVEPGKFLAARN